MSMHCFNFTNLIFVLIFIFSISSIAKALWAEGENGAFLAFVKGKEHFDRFCQDPEQSDKIKNINMMTEFDQEFTFDKRIEHMAQKFGAQLGTLHWLRGKWHRAKKNGEQTQLEQSECTKISKYMDSMYEYLFLVYANAEAASDLSLGAAVKRLPAAVAPQFKIDEMTKTTFGIVQWLNKISVSYFYPPFKVEEGISKWSKVYELFGQPKLLNETEVDEPCSPCSDSTSSPPSSPGGKRTKENSLFKQFIQIGGLKKVLTKAVTMSKNARSPRQRASPLAQMPAALSRSATEKGHPTAFSWAQKWSALTRSATERHRRTKASLAPKLTARSVSLIERHRHSENDEEDGTGIDAHWKRWWYHSCRKRFDKKAEQMWHEAEANAIVEMRENSPKLAQAPSSWKGEAREERNLRRSNLYHELHDKFGIIYAMKVTPRVDLLSADD